MKVLIVEDDFTSQILLQELLKRYCAAHVAANGREAVEAFRHAHEAEEPYDLVCLDIMMPEMDGHQALKSIRKIEADLGLHVGQGCKVLMTTALSDKNNVMQAFHEEVDGYLTKPIDQSRLFGYLEEFGLIDSGQGAKT